MVLIAALATVAVSLPNCSWDRPGVDPFVGNVPAAVDHYSDIPASTRAALKKRMARHQYDEIATIRRDSIEGRHQYRDLRDMHFGTGKVCRNISREKWTASNVERGLVYCEDGHCLIVPTVCNNVSRVTQVPPAQVAEAPPPSAAAEDPLQFEPPGAGATPSETPGGASSGSSTNAPTSFASSAQPGPPGGAPGSFVPIAPPPGNWVNGSGAGGGGIGRPALPLASMVPLPPVPEPATTLLMAAGLALLGVVARRRAGRGAQAAG